MKLEEPVRTRYDTLMKEYIEFYGAIEKLTSEEGWAFAIYGTNEPGEERGDEAIESGVADSEDDAKESVLGTLRAFIEDRA